jgi:hypothetical protein
MTTRWPASARWGVELAAVEGMLDEIHESLPSSRDQNGYTLGRIERHNIVVAVALGLGDGSGAPHARGPLALRVRCGILAGRQAGGVGISRQDGQTLGLDSRPPKRLKRTHRSSNLQPSLHDVEEKKHLSGCQTVPDGSLPVAVPTLDRLDEMDAIHSNRSNTLNPTVLLPPPHKSLLSGNVPCLLNVSYGGQTLGQVQR